MQIQNKEKAAELWLAEDDENVGLVMSKVFEDAFNCRFFSTLAELTDEIRAVVADPRAQPPDLLIADLVLPDGHFLDDFLKSEAGRDLAISGWNILILTSCDNPAVMHAALDLGVIDFVVKPFSTQGLRVKVERITRPRRLGHERWNAKNVTIDPATMKISNGEGEWSESLTAKEFQLVAALLNAREGRLARESIMESVWGSETSVSKNTFDVHLHSLRKKIAAIGVTLDFMHPDFYILSLAEKD